MGIVHHSNYVRYFELARIGWLREHDQPYRELRRERAALRDDAGRGRLPRPGAFDDELEIDIWLEAVHGASLSMAYGSGVGDALVATGAPSTPPSTRTAGLRRMPRERREELAQLATAPVERGLRRRGYPVR